jgi:FkbM family methyltransferase
MTAKPSRPIYYARSLLTLLHGVRPRSLVAALALALGRRGPRLLELRRSKARFMVRSLMDVWTAKEVCLDRDYERVGVPIQPGWTLVDIGAGIGEFAIDVAVRHPTCTVHAYEPAPETFEVLRQNVWLNEARNVHIHCAAVTGVPGVAALDVSSLHAARHHIARGDVPSGEKREVAAMTLAEVLDGLGTSICAFLKIDCEGGEYALLQGADRDTLARISRICLEYHDGPWGRPEHLVDTLAAAGFETALTGNSAWQEIGFLYAWRA